MFVKPRMKRVSTNPSEYGCKNYNELDVAAHTIMIEGLPKDVPRRKLESSIFNIFNQILSDEGE